MKVKCYFEELTVTMKRLASSKKHKESEALATVVVTLPQGGEKHKRMRKAVANTASTKEIKEVLGRPKRQRQGKAWPETEEEKSDGREADNPSDEDAEGEDAEE
ncbi:hypothetical protein SCLCIDRAFT_32843 [Scleroderma citrinum Foug A]|uniref:Uncharacterized protein n=1 Tax=Scleroderma citrinum Foug A TaxID=1036808 RepID=A0A0C3CUG9_9AGAM|nr:hypothetical protein SCLCIDRAFT_32843 [Scleroderma citrinum Foug A]